ncbi:MAG: tetratricopeptide repeat protein [Bacteroidales bacterium]|nr:tetratricopeptide repeat protein [Bacteroidales bacterium]
MNKVQINNIHKKILKLTYSGKLYAAASLIKAQDIINLNDGSSPLAMVEQTYKYMLEYTINGMADPNRETIYQQLQVSLLMMADAVRNIQLRKYTPSEIFSTSPNEMPSQAPAENNIPQWFNYILRIDTLPGQAQQMISDTATSNQLSWIHKSLIISVLTLSNLLYFDIKKYRLMMEFYLSNQEHIWQRALVGLVLISYFFNKRLKLYPESKDIFRELTSSPKFKQRYEATVLQIIRAIDTEKISKKINEEIIPEIEKMPGIKNKMKSDSITIEMLDEKNPEWQEYIEDNHEVFDKLSEVSKLQMEGGDVFINTFAMLKHYSFFSRIENWFMPFTPDNQEIKNLCQANANSGFNYKRFAEKLYNAPFICNSDKFSFCLSISHIPEDQRNALSMSFNGGLDDMAEIAKDDKLLHSEEYSYKILVQYIQDIYRFFKLNKLGKEFLDIFDKGFSPSGTMLFDTTFATSAEKRNVGEFFFKSEYYRQSYDIFQQISLESPNFEVFQKMGYSAQKFGDIDLALDGYLKAQLFESKQLWNLKKIGWCYRKLKQPEKALEYYREAEKLEPDNLGIATSIGRCLLEMENYNDALKYYYKVEYLDEKNTKVFRPIAWSNYQLGKYEQSLKYYGKIRKDDTAPEDHVLAGHNCRMLGKLKEAVEYYKKAISSKDFTLENLEEAINSDYNPENKENLSQENNLILEYIAYGKD